MEIKMKRKPVTEDTFIERESKLNMLLNQKIEHPKFLIILLKNRVASVIKEIRTSLELSGTEILSLDLPKEDICDFNLEIQSFLSDAVPAGDKPVSPKKVVILNGQNYETMDKVSEDLIEKWSSMCDEHCRFIFLIASENAYENMCLKFNNAKLDASTLDMRDYTDKIKSHLGSYKTEMLNITEKGKFVHRGKIHEFDYILNDGLELRNILSYKDLMAEDVVKGIDLHKYYYHLNSSQMMCVNFFYPLIAEDQLNCILEILGIDGKVASHEFEKDSDVEGSNHRKTKFDFYIKTMNGKNIYFEIKYTENEFGMAEDDEDHRKKFAEVYEPKLNTSEVINSEFRSRDNFFKNYQIIRNVININENSYVVFLYPEDNRGIRVGAKLAKEKIINESWQNHFKPVTWEAMTKEILCYIENHEDLKDYYINQFNRKYMLY